MKVRLTAMWAIVALLVGVMPALAQVQTGEITGKVSDDTGAVLPGATVTLTSTALIQPQIATSSEAGSFRFSQIPIGTYSVKFELPGFKTVIREGIVITIGFTAQVNQQLAISTVQETVTVSGESPIVDTKATAAKTTFDLESLQNIPSARDPWVMLQRVPNIAMDRMNVGGSQSGQQSGYISRGSNSTNNKWSLDGVDITDMSATGASPIYYDFDMMQEMQVTTGGADASQQTGGVGINLVTRSGTNRFKGSGRVYNTNDKFEADNVTDEIRAQGAGSGAPIQNINDFGFEVGGPILKDKLWYWGSYGKQDIKVGVVNFYKPTPECRPAGVPVGQIANVLGSTEAIRDCLATDLTTLNNYNYKVSWAPVRNNKFNFQNTWAEKVRNARDASDTRPIETAYRQVAVSSAYGTSGWDTGKNPVWKMSDQHVLTDRLLFEVQYAHVGNNFTLTFQDPEQYNVQPRFRHRIGLVGALVRRIDLRAPGAEHRPDDQLLPAEQVRRRPRVQGRLPLAHGARRVDQPHRRQRGRALLELDDDLRRLRRRLQFRPLPRRRDELQPEHERLVRPGRLHGEAPDVEPWRALGSSVGRGACRRSRGEPAHPDDHAGD